MASSYGTSTDNDKVRINAVILYAFQTDTPKGFIESFKKVLDEAGATVETHNKSAIFSEKTQGARAIAFQKALDGLREDLLPAIKSLPPVEGDKNEFQAQRSALIDIRKMMAEFTDEKDYSQKIMTRVKKTIDVNHAPTTDKLQEKSPGQLVLVQFVAKASVAKTADATIDLSKDPEAMRTMAPYLQRHDPQKGRLPGA